jgi:glyoxylase-like metal-dependent hydrolase (beta-lactamase superfamily II)
VKKALKILLGIVGVLVVALAVLYLGFVAPRYHGERCTWTLDLARARQLASSLPGDKPREIRVEDVSGKDVPRALACPGRAWDQAEFRVYAYQLVFPDRTIIVDSAMSLPQAKDLGMVKGYDEAAWGRVAAALGSASAVYVTHEHTDHMGGAFADDRWASNLRLTAPQLEDQVLSRPAISPAAHAAAKVVAYEGYTAVAPGVVLIAAAGHTPGSQMVFVVRADGTEVLLTGDTAWLLDNIEQEQPPPKLAFKLSGGNANENACQLSALKRVQNEIAIMPGHDPQRMQALVERGVFVRGFAARP